MPYDPPQAQTTPAAARTHAARHMARAPALCAHEPAHARARAHTTARACRYPEVDYYAASANGSLLGFPTAPDAQAVWASVEASRGIFRPCAPLIAPEAPRPLTNESH
jgi:hypothetical protein